MLTFWDDTDAIKRFAGDDFSLAKYYDFDSDYLIEKEAGVRHYEVSSLSPPVWICKGKGIRTRCAPLPHIHATGPLPQSRPAASAPCIAFVAGSQQTFCRCTAARYLHSTNSSSKYPFFNTHACLQRFLSVCP
jgi:hypothetical protein